MMRTFVRFVAGACMLLGLQACASGGDLAKQPQTLSDVEGAKPMDLVAYEVDEKPEVSIEKLTWAEFDKRYPDARGMRADGDIEWACGIYEPSSDTISLAPCADKSTLAHERAHAIQDAANRKLSENVADCVGEHLGDDLGDGLLQTPRGFCTRGVM